MKSNRTILAIALDIAACAGVLLTAATPSIKAQQEKATASPAATNDDSGKQAGTSGKAPVAVARAQERPKEESKKEAPKKAKKTKKSNKSKRDEAGTEAGTSGKK